MKLTPKIIVMSAVLIALSILLRRVLTIPLPIGILNFGGFPIILAGLLLGPVAGMIVGGLSDIITAFMFPIGAYIPFFTLTSMLTGCLPVIFVMALKKQKGASFAVIFITIALSMLITKALLIPIIMEFIFKIPFALTSLQGIIKECFHVPVYTILCRAILLTQANHSYVTAIPLKRRLFTS